jgi:anaerobic selenocysteine-containing dehydrogenase
MATERRPAYCALCISRCGCLATVEDGLLTRIDADPDHPTGQALCVKAKAAPEAVYDPTRILQPLRRTRPKGEADPGWVPISWDEALDLVAAKIQSTLARHGARGLAFGVATPSGTAVADSFAWIHRLAHACGSPNLVFATENCNWHKDFAPALTFGAGIGMPDYAHTGCILLWGFNPATSWLAQATAVREAQRRGARLIVVDPRHAGLAAAADLWLRPRPGSDGALALGIANLLLAEGRFDRDFVQAWSDAPLLVAEASGRRLTAADLAVDGDPNRYLAWDEVAGAPLLCPPRPANAPATARLALAGLYQVGTLQGPVSCRPVFDLYARRCAAWPPARVAEVTGVPAEQVEAAARLIAGHPPLSFFTWTGTCQQANATQTGRAIAALYALSGGLDAPGGNVWFAKPPLLDVAGFEWVEPGTRAQTLGLDDRPLGPPQRGWITTRDLFRAVAQEQPYPVSCFVSFGSNFLLSKPTTPGAEAALRQLDFFALAELHVTPTARFADLLLPVCTAWEREGLQAGFQVGAAAECHVQLRPALVPPQGESRADSWIVFELAKRLGHAERFFGGDPEAALAQMLAPTRLTPAELRAAPRGVRLDLETRYRKYRQDGFATPSRRLEFFSERLARLGQDPLPDFVSPAGGEDSRFPLLLTTAKWPQYCHSQQRQLPSLRRRMPEPLIEMHPVTAAARDVQAGDWVEVVTAVGRMRARARLDAHLAPEVVCAQYGWWQFPDGAGDANRLLDGERFDPVAGSNSLRHAPCQVCRVPRQGEPSG